MLFAVLTYFIIFAIYRSKQDNMKVKIITGLCIAGIICSVHACKTGTQSEKESIAASEVDSSIEVLQDQWEILEDALFLYPSPGEIIEGFFNADLEYKHGLVNSVEKKDSYLGSRSQALNLGIYITDLAYLAKFGLTGEAVDYLDAVHSLSNQVGVSTEVLESLLEKAKANINNPDSILDVSDEAFCQMVAFLETSKKENTLAMISAGAYIESLYLVLESRNEFIEDDPLFDQIGETVAPFGNLMSRAKKFEDDQNVASIIKYLNLINQTFEQLKIEETETTVSKEEGKLIIGGGVDLTFTAENFAEIKSTIHSIRTEITTI